MNIKKVKEKIKKEIDILTSNENFLESFQIVMGRSRLV